MENYISAKKENIEDIINIRIQYLTEYYNGLSIEQIYILKKEMKEYLEAHLEIDCFTELCFKDNKCVSCGILNIIQKVPNLRFPNSRFGEIYGVYTIPEYRKNGYATEIIKRLIRFCKKTDMSFIQLDASTDGKEIYKKCGFVESPSEYTQMKILLNKDK